MTHRGQIIEKYIRKHDIPLTFLAKKTPFTSRTMYRHFEDEKLSLEKVLEYSEALNHDFSDEIPEMALYKFTIKEPHVPYEISIMSAQSEAEYYRKKYEQLLEKYNEMLEKFNEQLARR